MRRRILAGLLSVIFLCTIAVPGGRISGVYRAQASSQTAQSAQRKAGFAAGAPRTASRLSELYVVKNTVEPRKPAGEIAGDNQERSTAIGDASQTVTNNGFQQILDAVREALSKNADELAREGERLAEKGTRKLAEAPRVANGKAERLIRKGNNCLNRSQELAEQASKYSTGASILKWGGNALSAYNIYNNTKEMQNLQNEHTSLRTAEAALLYADSALAVLSIAATLSTSVTPPGLAVQLAVGITAAVLHSDQFAEWANQQDSEFLDTLDSFFETLFPWMKTPDGVNCYKPNIYLYSAKRMGVRLRFRYPQLVTASIPDYGSGWTVRTGGGGKLETETGETFDYLFYESITSAGLFQTEKGYRIPAGQREEALEAVLTDMGFTENEIRDFTEFWCGKLEKGVDYVMYPQNTDTVNLAMPLEVDPVPETMERIWFAFCRDHGQAVETPDAYRLERSGEYALIEWGGLIIR